MNISLTPELEKMVQDKVKGGLYTSASEVIRESLRLMYMHEQIKQQRIDELNTAIDIGKDQLEQGAYEDGQTSRTKMKEHIAQIANNGLKKD